MIQTKEQMELLFKSLIAFKEKQNKVYYFSKNESIANLIPSEKIENIYNQIVLFEMAELDSNKKIISSFGEHYLIKLMINSRFVTFNYKIIENAKITNQSCATNNDSQTPNSSVQLVDATFCFDGKCYIFKKVEYSFLTTIICKLRQYKIYYIIANINLKTKLNYEGTQEEIYNFCTYFKNEKGYDSEFVQLTLPSISAYLIRRHFCPTYYFSNKSFYSFKGRSNESINLYNRLIRFTLSYVEKEEVFLKDRLNTLIAQLKEIDIENDNKIKIQDFKESDFIVLRTICTRNNFVYELVIHIENFYIFMMKKSFCSRNYQLEMEHEIDFCTNYSHRCFTPFYGFLKKNENIIGFIYEFMSNGTLDDFISKDKNNDNKVYSLMAIKRIVEGLKYLKSNKLIHRDLKPSNILLDHDFFPYISDFNTVKSITSTNEVTEMTDDFGSILYMSPEQYSSGPITYSTDIYSFGLIVYFLFEKKNLKSDNNKKILPISNVSDKLQNLYEKCVQEIADERPKIEEIQIVVDEEIHSFISDETNFEITNISFRAVDSLLFYENLLCQKNNHKGIIDCIEIIFNLQFLPLSLEKYKNPTYLKSIGTLYFYGDIVKQDFSKATKFLELSYKQGNLDSCYLIGKMYFEGKGVEKNYQKAKKYFEISAKFNDLEAYDKIGLMYQYGLGVEQDYVAAERFLRHAIIQNDANALIHLGIFYENVKKDYFRAFQCYEKSIEGGFFVAGYFNIGKMYEEGLGVPQDYSLAKKYYEKLAFYENERALFNLGKLYQYGHGVKKDINKALELYNKSSKKNYRMAQITLGYMYYIGYDVVKYYEKASYYFKLAYENGSSIGAYFLGEMNEKGFGVKKNLEEAYRLYEISATDHNSFALEKLGYFYENGYIVNRDYSKALQCYVQASKQNNSYALVRIGNLHKYGRGVEQSIPKMFSYYLNAAQQNNPDALFYLGNFYSSGEFYEPEYNKSIEYYSKCSKIVNFENLYEEISEMNHFKFYGVLRNSFRYPSINNIGLIYIQVYEDLDNANKYITEAGVNEYPFGQNNLGLLFQFYYDNIDEARYFFEKASKSHFALAEYNLGYLLEKGGKIEDAVESYIKASEDEDKPFTFRNENIIDKQLEISKTFIICLTNMKLSYYYLTQLNPKESKIYFTRSFSSLLAKSLNKYQFKFHFHKGKKDKTFEYLKEFILNFPLFDVQLDQDILSNQTETLEDEKKSDDADIAKKNCEEEEEEFIEEINGNEEGIIFENPDKLFDFAVANKNLKNILKDEIKRIIDAMSKILYIKPYPILFGRIKIRKILNEANTNIHADQTNITQTFYDGFN